MPASLHISHCMPPIYQILFAFLLLQAGPLSGQRQWGLSDSTHYPVGGDTMLIASRHMLYRALAGDTTLLWDFTVTQQPNYFIRDVDHWSASEFYVVVGSRYIGGSTTLFKSTDAGNTWSVDTSFLAAALEPPSINQMAIAGDTAYLFNGYYASEVLRSFDRGISWQHWFNSLIAHYYGIHHCGESAYIYGMEGDGFQPCMWLVPDSLWGMQVNGFYSGCHQGLPAPGIHYAPSLEYAEVVHYFDSLASELCTAVLPVNESSLLQRIALAPNRHTTAWC